MSASKQTWTVSYYQSVNERYGSDMNHQADRFMKEAEGLHDIEVTGSSGGCSLVAESGDPRACDNSFDVEGTHANVRQVAYLLGELIGKDVVVRASD